MTVEQLPFIEKVVTNRQAFGLKLIDIAGKLLANAKHIMIVMNNETAGTMSHTIKNPKSSATGLIQFMEKTARNLGTTCDALTKMTNVEQLDYVYKYLLPYKGKMNTVADVYLAVFFPAALSQELDYVFPKWASDANPIFDLNKNGILTKKEFVDYVNTKYAKYLK